MIDRRLESELASLADRQRRVRLHVALGFCWCAIAVATVTAAVVGRWAGWDGHSAALLGLGAALAAAVALYVRTIASAPSLTSAARQIEQCFPALDQRLLTAIEPDSTQSALSVGYLKQLVVQEAVDHSLRYDWQSAVPSQRLSRVRLFDAGGLALLFAALVFAWQSHAGTNPDAPRSGRLFGTDRFRVAVEPGDADVERGTDVLVLARFSGPIPADVHVSVTSGAAATRRIALSKSLNDPLFGGRISAVSNDSTYVVEFDGDRTSSYRLRVFDYPDALRIDAEVAPPAYTGLAVQRIDDTRNVSAVEGSNVTLICQLNKPVARAWLSDESGESLEFTMPRSDSTECRVTTELRGTRRLSLHLLDAEGRSNKLPPEITLTGLPDRPPQIALKFPARDMRASPLEEISLEAEAWDDFGISTYGVSYIHGTDPAKHLELGGSVAAKEKRRIEHVLRLEDLRAAPDQLISYYFWAEDPGPDGSIRRTMSDMYFIEVRPFEEIYRQGEQPTEAEMRQQQQQGQGGAAQQAGELAELQKQIINATWKLIRQTNPDPADRARDAAVISDSQRAAREQLESLAERAEAAGAKEAIEQVDKAMASAIEQLGKVGDDGGNDSLQRAITAEQAAYQGLLKLRAREYQVVRSRQMAQRGGSSGGNRANRQLDELELDSRENRYENRRAPAAESPQATREDNQILNRLRELARRQEDLNRRLQELQSALQAARDDARRQELQRQLERLRDEQQEMLRDLDELRDRMDRPENQRRMAESREQLDQTRNNMRQASDAMRQEQLAPAITSGTRAERELEQVRDDFRRRTANQFADQMRTMRDSARELAQNERELSDQLQQLDRSSRQSLRDDRRSNTIEQMTEQQSRLGTLTEEMKRVSEAAETAEPLLSRQLYDSYRDTTQRHVDRSMELVNELLRRGLVPEATKSEATVRQDVDRLRQSVERAARSVLGDPTEATRRALEEVEDLNRQLQREVARADPDGEPRDGSGRRPSDANQQSNRAEPQNEQGSDRQGTNQRAASGERPGERSERQANPQSGGQGQRGENSQQQSSSPGEPGQREGSGGTRPDQPRATEPGDSRSGTRGTNTPGRAPANTGGRSGNERDVDIANWTGPGGPITGEAFRQWSDRLRDVEEMLENPDLRAEVAEINDRAREFRRDWKRHSQEPNWPMVRRLVAEPLVELQAKLREELARQESSDKLVPIDRDPVPRRFSDLVRQYYERLGSEK